MEGFFILHPALHTAFVYNKPQLVGTKRDRGELMPRQFDIWRNRGFSDKLEQGAEARVLNFLGKVEQADDQQPIDPESVDYEFVNPTEVAESFRATLGYLARVELDVERNVREVHAVFGDTLPDTDRKFVDIWGPQELHHGYVLDRATQVLGLPAPAVNLDMDASIRVAGTLGRYVPGLKDALFYSYMTTGVVTEAAASRIYRLWSDQLEARGEGAFAATAIDRIGRQEPKHLAYYRMRGAQVRDTLSPWQIKLARAVKERSMPLAGLSEQWHKGQLGRLVIELTGGDETLSTEYLDLVSQVESVYQRMMYYRENGGNVPGIVTRSIAECREIALIELLEERRADS